VRGDDFVYTLPITLAKMSGNEVLNNRAATLPPGLPYQPLAWNAITMYVDPRSHTMATLYGNEAAMKAVRAGASGSTESTVNPSSGSVFALVTWAQREDPHWFGARIPNTSKSVEFVEAGAPGGATAYRCYDGPGLDEHGLPPDVATERTRFISTLAPAWLP
jgi:hypothetical protein